MGEIEISYDGNFRYGLRDKEHISCLDTIVIEPISQAQLTETYIVVLGNFREGVAATDNVTALRE